MLIFSFARSLVSIVFDSDDMNRIRFLLILGVIFLALSLKSLMGHKDSQIQQLDKCLLSSPNVTAKLYYYNLK